MTIKDIQKWEKAFAEKKGVPFGKRENAHDVLWVGMLKLMEEVGELSEAVLRKRYSEVPAEVSDVIVFACKIASVVEDFYNQPSLTEALKRKMKYCEKRTYDRKTKGFTKPKNKEFK